MPAYFEYTVRIKNKKLWELVGNYDKQKVFHIYDKVKGFRKGALSQGL